MCSRPLGSIDGVKLQLKSPELKARISALEKALNYGEQGLDLVIEGLKDESWDVRKQAYILLQNRAESKVKQVLTIFEEKKLKSSVGVDYRNLRNLLAQGKWKEADEETRRVMFALAKADQEYEQVRSRTIQTLHLRKQKIQNEEIYIQYFTANYILIAQEKIPREDLHTIDQLWVKHSNGRFGFSVQKHIYQSLGGTRWFNEETTQAFAKKVGWEKKNDFVMYYSDITFDITAPEGHLPVIIGRLHPSDYDFLTNAIANFQLWGKPWRVPVVRCCDICYFRFLLLS
ncbi:GUN4 domain-containing protein [Nostoc sp. UIC 10890]